MKPIYKVISKKYNNNTITLDIKTTGILSFSIIDKEKDKYIKSHD